LTGRENIFLNGAILGMTKTEIKSKLEEIINFSEIGKFIDTPVKKYSSGMYVRLAFAVAAHLDPEILIVDEVLAVGDANFQRKCISKMTNIATSGRTILFVSHSIQAIKKLCSKCVLLEHGKVTAYGTVDSIINLYEQRHLDRIEHSYQIPAPATTQAVATLLQIQNSKGELTGYVEVADQWSIQLFFTINQKVNNFSVAIGLINNRGDAIGTARTQPSNLEPGQYQASFISDTQLAPGHYSLATGLSTEGKVIHYCETAGYLDVISIETKLTTHDLILNPMQATLTKL
jgi:lipopolysaccharide transport system ATP-binding protein